MQQEAAGSREPIGQIQPRDEKELTRIAYSTVEGLEFEEPNDGVRLGYHIYRFVAGQTPTLEMAIYEAKARTSIAPVELERIIRERLNAAGVSTR